MKGADEYLDALRQLQFAEGEVSELGRKLTKVGDSLQHSPYSFYVMNMGGFPPEVTAKTRGYKLYDIDWPSPQTIGEALLKMHEARSKVSHLWENVPEEYRGNLSPPPPIRS